MINVRKHHPVLLNRLRQICEAGDAVALNHTLQNLSAADFRTAGYLLSDVLLPEYEQHFWDFFLLIVPTKPKAFLGTFLKAAVTIYKKDATLLNFDALETFARQHASPIDKRKCLEYLIPCLTEEADAVRLLELFHPETAAATAVVLLKAATPLSFFLLLRTLQTADESPEKIREYCLYLMKRGDSLSFNMAVILRSYFGLSSLPGTFSLKLEPYQLGRMNDSYEYFKKFLVDNI